MLRTIVLIAVLVIVSATVTGVVYVTRLRHDVIQGLDGGYLPPASAYSSAFTDALWARVESGTPVDLDRSVTLLGLVQQAMTRNDGGGAKGFLFASVAARSMALREGLPEDLDGARAIVVLRELMRTEALLKRFDVDTLAAMYAESAPFGPGLVGLAAASEQLLGKPAALLDAREAATLLELSWTTNRCDLPRLAERRDALLGRMQAMQLSAPFARKAPLGLAVLPLQAACQP